MACVKKLLFSIVLLLVSCYIKMGNAPNFLDRIGDVFVVAALLLAVYALIESWADSK